MSESQANLADDSVRAEGGSSAIKVTLVGFDKPLLTAIALVLSLSSAAACWYMAEREERRVYFTMRCEGFVEQLAFEHKPTNPEYLKSICGPREK